MTTRFDGYVSQAEAAVEDVLAEAVTITPRASVRYGAPGADPGRDAFTVSGVLSIAPTDDRVLTNDGRGGAATRATIEPAEFWISGASYAAAGIEVRRGDRLSARGVSYAVAEVHLPDTGDVVLILTRENG